MSRTSNPSKSCLQVKGYKAVKLSLTFLWASQLKPTFPAFNVFCWYQSVDITGYTLHSAAHSFLVQHFTSLAFLYTKAQKLLSIPESIFEKPRCCKKHCGKKLNFTETKRRPTARRKEILSFYWDELTKTRKYLKFWKTKKTTKLEINWWWSGPSGLATPKTIGGKI
jgi:hypothetical protein